jgi:hypothetical protein
MAGQIQIYLQQRDAGILGQVSRVEIPYLNAMTDTIGNPAPPSPITQGQTFYSGHQLQGIAE